MGKVLLKASLLASLPKRGGVTQRWSGKRILYITLIQHQIWWCFLWSPWWVLCEKVENFFQFFYQLHTLLFLLSLRHSCFLRHSCEGRNPERRWVFSFYCDGRERLVRSFFIIFIVKSAIKQLWNQAPRATLRAAQTILPNVSIDRVLDSCLRRNDETVWERNKGCKRETKGIRKRYPRMQEGASEVYKKALVILRSS